MGVIVWLGAAPEAAGDTAKRWSGPAADSLKESQLGATHGAFTSHRTSPTSQIETASLEATVRVEIRAAQENARSRAIPERLGFTQEGTLRQVERVGDRYLDNVVYAMLAEDWKG